MAFTLNAGEFDLGAGYIGRGTVLAGEILDIIANSIDNVDRILGTSGLEGVGYRVASGAGHFAEVVSFRSSDDSLTSAFPGVENSQAWATGGEPDPETWLDNAGRVWLGLLVQNSTDNTYNAYYGYLNSTTTASKVIVKPNPTLDNTLSEVLDNSTNWRLLARDHQTALVHYPSTAEEGSVFAASCINSSTQWGLWIGGDVGERSGYFNRTQGVFAIVLLSNGGSSYFTAWSPSTANFTTRNDSPLRNFNIIPAAGQSTTNDKICELLLLRDQGSNYSAVLGKVPGFFYIDPNKVGFDSYAVGDVVDIDPLPTATFEGRDRAIIAGRWGLDASLSISNVGALFTVGGSPNRRTLENGVRLRFTATPPTGTATGTDYWVVNWNETAFTFNLSTVEGGSALTPSSDTTSTVIRKAALVAMRCY